MSPNRNDKRRSETFVVAEVANVHEGDPAVVRTIIDQFSGLADAIKFQAFTADELAVPSYPDYDLYEEWAFQRETWRELVELAKETGFVVLADVFGEQSAEKMYDIGVDGFKVHNADVSNKPLLEQVGGYGGTIFLSAGGSTKHELRAAKRVLSDQGVDSVSLVYGIQNYPTALADTNLGRVKALKNTFECAVGFASHIDASDPLATQLPAWAVAAGAEILEVNVTHDRDVTDVDVESSLEPPEFEEMVRTVADVEASIGDETLALTESEREYRTNHKKWVVSTREIAAGEYITRENVTLKRIADAPNDSVRDAERILGQKATRNIPELDTVGMTDTEHKIVATLAVRAESTRLYGKPMQLVGDRPILQHLIDRLREASTIDEIGLAISDAPSQNLFSEFAAERDLPTVVGPEEDVLKRLIMLADHTDADIVVRATTENPYIHYQNLDELIQRHLESNADLTVTEKLPFGAFVEVIAVDALKEAHEYGDDRHRSELCSLYITENPDTFDIQSVSPPAELQRPDVRLTVDNPCDLILARELWRRTSSSGLPTLSKILDVYDRHDLEHINDDKPDGTTDEVVDVTPHIYGDLTTNA